MNEKVAEEIHVKKRWNLNKLEISVYPTTQCWYSAAKDTKK